jgi:hypothetical protein
LPLSTVFITSLSPATYLRSLTSDEVEKKNYQRELIHAQPLAHKHDRGDGGVGSDRGDHNDLMMHCPQNTALVDTYLTHRDRHYHRELSNKEWVGKCANS